MKQKAFFTLICACMIIAGELFAQNVAARTSSSSPTKTLDLGQLFRYYGTDKDAHGYTSMYHTLFDHLKKKPITVLEIGIGTMIPNVHSSMVGYSAPGYKPGGSLRAWRDYFVNATIHGVDIQADTQFTDEPRIITHLCNSTDKTKVDELMQSLGNITFDIIIDDGSHIDKNQIKTLTNFYPYLKDGGIYIIEDISPGSKITAKPEEVSKLCNGGPLFFVGLHNNIAVIYKKPLSRDDIRYSY
jgi:hypothetical protein